jgi:acetylornithine deacetylase/succinyl-diaminopimelate desuccinylase-like protein
MVELRFALVVVSALEPMQTTDLSPLARSPAFRQYLTDLLVEVCKVDTTPQPDVAAFGKAERQVFDILERHFAGYGFAAARAERRPMNPAIAKHPFFSQLYYTLTPERPQGLSVEETYRDRSNLFFLVDGAAGNGTGRSQAVNVHIDVVRPYIPPRVEGDKVFGRGACDDKGPCIALMGALKLVAEHLRASGRRLGKQLTAMIVIEEEMGGNGSLSAALDRDLKKRYDSVMVLECCQNKIHPGNRGALWYKITARAPGAWLNLFQASAFLIEEMGKEGRAIKSESDHPLFPHRPVQTCHGVIGPYGEHPSRINGRVDFDIEFADAKTAAAARKRITDVVEFAVADYIGLYGDKTKVLDASGKPKVDHHYDLVPTERGFTVQVHGSTGHMGSILENDGAITKMATMVRALVRSRRAIEAAAGGKMQLRLHGHTDPNHLVLEGGQGFLPTHTMPEVMERLRAAVHRGAETYARAYCGQDSFRGADDFSVTYDKLHNAAFAGRADSPDMQAAIEAAKLAGMWKDDPIRGWDVSCDARIFACEYPDIAVLTSGPGALNYAHSDHEQIGVGEMAQFAEFLAHFILKQTGTMN